MACQVIVGVFDRTICVLSPDDDSNATPNPTSSAPDNLLEAPVELEPNREPAMFDNAEEHTSAAADNPLESVVELEPDREPDMFDNAEEYVGFDDEGMYDTVPPAPEFAQPTNNANTYATAEPSDTFPTFEAEVDDADALEINVLHDPENPKIVKGELFPDINTFRKAIRHYAVKNGFEFAPGTKTDKTRFIAKCAAEGCPWRIHASTSFDKKTVQIKVLPAEHNYPSTKLVEGKMAT
ncbi:unnamed protein product [Urochloa humidicola]